MNAMRICSVCSKPLAANTPQGLCPECLLKAGLGTGVDIGPDSQSQAESGKVPFVAPTPEELAKLFPQLEILSFIGQGGMGAVYKARQKALDRVVALKILPPGIGKDPAFTERFTREAKALAKLNHPGVVTLYEFGQADGLFFFLMEFVDGVNLRQLLEAGRLSPREALAIVPQICDALQYAHDQGIVHRDIKPENILLDRQGRVKVADFGLAKLVGAGGEPSVDAGVAAGSVVLTEAGKVMGTAQYMAPEQREHPAEVDHRVDIYSLGVVLYQMLTGELPGKPIEPPSRKVQVDVRLDEVVLRALEKNPELRFQQVSEVKTLLETISTDTGEVRSQSPRQALRPAQHPSSTANTRGEALARELEARDYVLDIGSCLRRGLALVRGRFWPAVGATTLFLLLLDVGGFLFAGPLLGGLCLYFLKRIRGEQSSLETVFSGFRIAFVPLFLAGLVGIVAILLLILSIVIPIRLFSGGLAGAAAAASVGLACLLLPGVFLAGVTILTLVLVIDKRLDFWPAFKLSGAAISRHWGKFFGFMFVLVLINAAGMMAGVIGLLVTFPVTLSAAIFAYEDIFAAASRAGHPAAFAGDKTAHGGLRDRPARTWKVAANLRTQIETAVNDTSTASPANRTNNSAPRLLNIGTSLVTTPEQLGTFDGQFFLYRRKSQMLLEDRQLTFARGGTTTVIPLAAIRDLSIGHYPRTMHPAGLDFISVTYDEGGQIKRLFFSPYESWFGLPSHFNQFVAEWFIAIRAAIVAATGREPGNTPADQLGVPSGSKVIYALLLAPVVLCGTFLLAGVLAGVVMRQHAGDAATHSLLGGWYVIILGVLGFGFLALALRRLFGGSRKPAAPPHLSRTAVVALLLSLGGCMLSLLLGLVLFQSWGWVFGSFFAIETAALILGIVAWDKRTGKAAVILSFALMLAWIPGTLTHMAQVAPNRLPKESPRKAAAMSPDRVAEVRCEGPKAYIRAELDDLHELRLFIGSDALVWSARQTGSTFVTATLEASDQIKLDDGSMGHGLIFQAWSVRHYIAITPDGPVPFGEVVFRENANVAEKDGTFTFADIRQADGTLIPISISVRPVSGRSSGRQSFGAVAEPPKLRFLAWQDENPSWRDWKAWRPNGERADTAEEQGLLLHHPPTRIDLSATREGRGVRVLFVWFSHPHIERRSYAEMTMADSMGQTISPCLDGYGGTIHPAKPSEGELGWVVRWFAPAQDATLPSMVNLTLRYSLGDWRFPLMITREMFSGTMETEWGNIPGAGESLDGKAFVSLVRDTAKGRDLQVDFAAETTDGRLIEPSGALESGPPEMRHGRFQFDVPLGQIKEFRLRTCPIRMVEYRNVSLQAGHSAEVQESPVSSSQPPAFGPVIERVIATTDGDDQGLVLFDLETGKSFKPPFPLKFHPNQGPAFVELTPELRQWIRARDVDVLLHLGEKNWDMMTLDMQERFAGQLNEWETISPERAIALFAQKDAEHVVRDEVPASSFGNSYRDGFGSFNAFRTRSRPPGLSSMHAALRTRRGWRVCSLGGCSQN